MTARSPSAFFVSLTLHALIVLAIVVAAWWTQRREEMPPIFELVMGPGDNYAATEAPRGGTEPSVKLDLPEPVPLVTPVPLPEPAAPVVTPAPEPTPVPQKKAPAKEQPKKVEPAPKKAEPAPPKKAEPAPKAATTSYEDFVKKQGPPQPRKTTSTPQPIKPKLIDAQGIVGGSSSSTSTTKTGAGGTVSSRAEVELTQAYIALIVQRIRQSMEAAGVTDQRTVVVAFNVSASGEISSPRIVTTSGSADFDRAVLTAFRSIRPIGPPPTSRAEAFEARIRMTERG